MAKCKCGGELVAKNIGLTDTRIEIKCNGCGKTYDAEKLIEAYENNIEINVKHKDCKSHVHFCKQCSDVVTDEVTGVETIEESTNPADFYVVGYNEETHTPYRGYLCSDHLDVMMDMGLKVKKQRTLVRGA